jgi:hypothetical protein
MPDFPKLTENTCRIFPVEKVKKGHWDWKRSVRVQWEMFNNRTARYVVHERRPNRKKWVKDLKSARTGFTGTFKFYTEKSYNLLILFSLSQLLICQNLTTNEKKAKQMKWEVEFWAVARIRIPVGESGSSKKKANWIEKCKSEWEFKRLWFRIPVGVSGPNNG